MKHASVRRGIMKAPELFTAAELESFRGAA